MLSASAHDFGVMLMWVIIFYHRSQSVSLYMPRGTNCGRLIASVVVMKEWSESRPFSGLQHPFFVMVVVCTPVSVRSEIVSRYLAALGKSVNVLGMFCRVSPSCCISVTSLVPLHLLLGITSGRMAALFAYHIVWWTLKSLAMIECLLGVCVLRKVEASVPDCA